MYRTLYGVGTLPFVAHSNKMRFLRRERAGASSGGEYVAWFLGGKLYLHVACKEHACRESGFLIQFTLRFAL